MMIKIAAENLVDLGCWRISRDAVANRLGPSTKRLGPVRFPAGTSMIGGQDFVSPWRPKRNIVGSWIQDFTP
jgi:hypothetical protein